MQYLARKLARTLVISTLELIALALMWSVDWRIAVGAFILCATLYTRLEGRS